MSPRSDASTSVRGSATKLSFALGLGIVIATIIVFGFLLLYRAFWGPGAFVERYVERIAVGDAAGALAMPGVAPAYSDLDSIARGQASEALLRSSVLTSEIDNVHIDGFAHVRDGVATVDMAYELNGQEERMSFRVVREGFNGLVPSWKFEATPLSVIDVTVRGSWRFSVNGFEMDKRQLSPAGLEADPLAPVSMLAFAPGAYDVSVDTAATTAAPIQVAAPGPLGIAPVDVQTVPTDQLTDVVQKSVDDFLDQTCTTQTVLHPSGCPFGAPADITALGITQDDVSWTIVDYPLTRLAPDGDDWQVRPASGMARLNVTIADYYTGALVKLDRDVYFTMVADVDVREDGGVHITIDAA